LFEKYKQQMEKKAKKSKDGEPVSQQPQKPDAAQQPFAQIQGSEPVYETPFGGASAFYGSGAEPQISSPTVDLSMAEALSQGPGRAFLKRIKTNDMIEITKKHFKIGKERSYADYCPSDIIGLSRSHANIVTESDGYFITDTNSTNHTYLNGALIPSNQPYKLENGMRVRFANEEFEFIIQES
jgi:hypothetical protein